MQRTLIRTLHNHLQTPNILPLSLLSTICFSLNSTRRNHTIDEIPVHYIQNKTKPDGHQLVQMIRNSTTQGNIFHGEQLHCYVLRSGFAANVYVTTALVTFYAKLLSLESAHKVFVQIPQPGVVTWNIIISGYVHAGKLHEALHLFLDLNKSDLRADAYSVTSALAACGQLSLLRLGTSIHSRIIMYGLESNVVVANCLIDVYGKCSLVEEAVRVFEGLIDKDVISWNSVIAACARNQKIDLAFAYFGQMPYRDTISYNELISGVARFGNIDEAIDILQSMPYANSSSWSAIITGYVVRNRPWEALDFFTRMHSNGVAMDDYTFSSILSGVACASALTWGTLLHCCTIKKGLVTSTIIGSALIGMYSKCGHVKDAETFFLSLPSTNIVTWNTIISGFAHNGESNKVVKYFEELRGVKGLKPDDITFINLLAACSHNKMPLERAYEYFMSMIDDYGIKPRPEHLCSMIRLMGHHGEVWRAEKLIHELGLGSCPLVWRALLGACGTCGNLEVAKVAAAKVTELKGDDEYGYVILSNINKSHGNWVDANASWKQMRDKGVVKGAGSSWIEGGNANCDVVI